MSWTRVVVSSGLEKEKETEKGEGGLHETGEMTEAGMAGACEMKASKSALKSTHTVPFSPSLCGCFFVHRLLALWQHIVHSAEHTDEEYIYGTMGGEELGEKKGKSKCSDWSSFV